MGIDAEITRFEPVEGGTRVRQVPTLEPRGAVCRFSPLVRVLFARQIAARLDGIKAHLEEGGCS